MDVSQPPLYPVDTYSGYLIAAMSPRYLSRHSTRILQTPFHPDTSAAISPEYLSRRSTQPKSHFLRMSHSRHYILLAPTTDISQPPCHPDTPAAISPGYLSRHSIQSMFHLLRILHTRMSHSRHATRIPQSPFQPDTSVAILSGRHPTSPGCLTAAILQGRSHTRHSAFSGYFTPGCLTAAMPPGYLNRHSIWIPQPLFYPADTPPPPGCLTVTIIPG